MQTTTHPAPVPSSPHPVRPVDVLPGPSAPDAETATCVHSPLPDGAPGWDRDRWLQLAVPIEGEVVATLETVATAAGVPLAHLVASMLCRAVASFCDPACPEVLADVVDDAREWAA